MPEANRTKMRIQWKLHKLAWNLSGGRLGRKIMGLPILELITIGRKTGQERQILIMYVNSDGAPAIVGTNAGRDTDPAWVVNLRANPRAKARWDGKWHEVTAAELDGDEYARAWATAVAATPLYAEYKESLTRPVPIMRLESR